MSSTEKLSHHRAFDFLTCVHLLLSHSFSLGATPSPSHNILKRVKKRHVPSIRSDSVEVKPAHAPAGQHKSPPGKTQISSAMQEGHRSIKVVLPDVASWQVCFLHFWTKSCIKHLKEAPSLSDATVPPRTTCLRCLACSAHQHL